MKKLLLVLAVVAMASFLFVGCLPGGVTPDPTPDPTTPEICPTITIAGSYTDATTGKIYVKSKTTYTVVVTYAQPTEGVTIKYTVATGTTTPTAPYYANADKTVYTAEVTPGTLDCHSFMVITSDCYGECTCTKTFTVDKNAPQARMKVTVPACVCEDCSLTFASDYVIVGACADTAGCCGDDCSGFASWSIDVYNQDPYDVCCTIPCATPVSTCSGSACPISCATSCLFGSDAAALVAVSKYYVIIDLADNVGKSKKYWATIVFDSGCNVTEVKQWTAANKAATGSTTNTCIDWTIGGTDITVTDATVDYFFLGEATCSSVYSK